MAPKLKLIKGRGYETHNTKEVKKVHKDESKENAAEDTIDEDLEGDPPVPLLTHVNNILHSVFSNVSKLKFGVCVWHKQAQDIKVLKYSLFRRLV